MIRFEQVSYTFPGRSVPVVKNVSLSLTEGEQVCIAGANGSGKTTLALLLAGLLKPTEGRVYVDDTPVEKVPQGLAALGFQDPDDQMVASIVEKEIVFGLELQNWPMPEMESEVAAIANKFGISPQRRREIPTLSGGEKQKVAIAALTVTHPRLLILDEPDSFLDKEGKAAIEAALQSLQESSPGVVIVRVTQEFQTMQNCGRLLVLDQGRVVADGSSSEVLANQRLMEEAEILVGKAETDSAGRTNWIGQSQAVSPKIEVKSLTFSYGKRELISDLSFEWRAGDIVGVIGATGSGKSTLALLLCGLLKPTSGGIRLLHGDVASERPAVTLALQQPERQFFLPTCADEIAFGPRNFGRQLTTAEVDRNLTAVGLEAESFRHRDPLTLSVGEQRRLAFAVLEALDRPFMIYDEPTAGLDARGIAQFVAMARRLADSGRGIMVVSHDHGLIERLASRVISI